MKMVYPEHFDAAVYQSLTQNLTSHGFKVKKREEAYRVIGDIKHSITFLSQDTWPIIPSLCIEVEHKKFLHLYNASNFINSSAKFFPIHIKRIEKLNLNFCDKIKIQYENDLITFVNDFCLFLTTEGIAWFEKYSNLKNVESEVLNRRNNLDINSWVLTNHVILACLNKNDKREKIAADNRVLFEQHYPKDIEKYDKLLELLRQEQLL
jgi:hypothetical protein